MENIKLKSVGKKILALVLVPFMLSGCARRSDCKVPTAHAHKYYRNASYGTIYTYLDCEDIMVGSYVWTKDYIDITKDDEAFLRVKGDMFDGEKNWGYLYNYMASKKDYLEFYYDYTTRKHYTDEDGKEQVKKVRHTGWSTDPRCEGATGEVRVNHYRFYGYKIIYKNGKYITKKSGAVDDIRSIIDEYPYFTMDCSTLIGGNSHRCKVKDLPNLKPSDFNDFRGPDLTTSDIHPKTK